MNPGLTWQDTSHGTVALFCIIEIDKLIPRQIYIGEFQTQFYYKVTFCNRRLRKVIVAKRRWKTSPDQCPYCELYGEVTDTDAFITYSNDGSVWLRMLVSEDEGKQVCQYLRWLCPGLCMCDTVGDLFYGARSLRRCTGAYTTCTLTHLHT